jgi:two-component system, LuxR family, sensor kinase FixL
MDPVKHLHILVIEDDADTRANLRDILEMDDHHVETAGSAAEALARGEWSLISAILLDRKLPDATADELLPRLKRAAPDAAVIVVTGFADLHGAVSALRQGATDYVLKPIEPDDLRARLRRIAESQRTGNELKRQAEIVRSLLANASDAIVVVDSHGDVLLHNPAAERLIGPMRVGAPPAEWTQAGRAARTDANNTTYTRQEPPLARALRREQVIDEEVFIRQPGAESGRWMSVNASPIHDERGVKGAVVIYRDITERKRAEDELRRQRDLAEGLLAAAPAVVVVLDPDGRITRFNRFAEQLSGFDADEVLGRDFLAALLPDREQQRIRDVFRKTLDEVDTAGTVSAIVTKYGRERTVRWSYQALKDAPSRLVGLLAIGQDVTDLSEAQERALRAERLAAIGQMVAGLTHESRNALQRSQACLEMLALQVQDRPKALDLIARLQGAQDHLHHLYEDVRGYAAPIRLARSDCDLSEIWRQAWAHLELQRKGRSTSLREFRDEPNSRCAVDPFRLGQVFQNVLENALAACADPVEVEVRYSRAQIDDRPALRIAVRDNGPGLGPDARQRIFEPFYTTKTKGTGLGMAICRRIVEAHGGRLAVGEGDGERRGAEIIITLPRGEP